MTKVKIPKKVLEKNLPNLTDESYIGVSSRVWGKLVKIHGVTEDGTPAKSTEKKSGENASGQDDHDEDSTPTEAPKD